MNKEDFNFLIGKYLNGYKIVKIEDDPFIKEQINLWTDEVVTKTFGDRSIVKFFVRNEGNNVKIYQELVNKENTNLKQALNEIKQYIHSEEFFMLMNSGSIIDPPKDKPNGEDYFKAQDKLDKIIDKVLGGSDE